ncbi:hypothetical protein HPB48_013022 [Haemaphysalis longicornis]|uniref:Uncharacterized protein n=1 Tax=Haemaphysalis longicornis TaxID=44386 RepID=A0A9J6GSU6_HAELO|nr:hypothetical protein HPB48_013022 [Haemaphysalis longicornis]
MSAKSEAMADSSDAAPTQNASYCDERPGWPATQMVLLVPTVTLTYSYYLLEEYPSWLLATRQLKRAKRTLCAAAWLNGLPEEKAADVARRLKNDIKRPSLACQNVRPPSVHSVSILLDITAAAGTKTEDRTSMLIDVVARFFSGRRAFCMFLSGFTVMFFYYGLMLRSAGNGGARIHWEGISDLVALPLVLACTHAGVFETCHANEQLQSPARSVVCYVGPDQDWRSLPADCTHLVYRSLTVDVPTLRLVDSSLPRKQEHAIRQVAELGRSNVRPMVRLTMEPGQLASLCRRTVRSGHTGRLARNVARWLLPHGYIGVDLDLWTPTNKDEANATYYSSIVTAMKRTLDTSRLLLSANVHPIPGLMEDLQLPKLRSEVHFIVLNPCVDYSEPCPLRGSLSWARFVRWTRLRGVALKGAWTARTSEPLMKALSDYQAPQDDILDWPATMEP